MSKDASRDELAALHGGGLVPFRTKVGDGCEAVLAGVDLEHERHLRRDREQADKILKRLRKEGLDAVEKIHHSRTPMAKMIALLDYSWELRHEDPPRMVEAAWLARQASGALDPRRYGRERVLDFQARAQAELGNAFRVANRPDEAAEALGRAREIFECGSRDKFLEIRLLELEASLAAAYRQFGRASEKLLSVLKFYTERKDCHLSGRTLILMGLYAGYAGDYAKGISHLENGLALIDAGCDASLACAAAHNLILFLVDTDRFEEAKRLRLLHARHLVNPGGRINQIMFRSLEGRIDAGQGRYARAEAIFREVTEGFEHAGLPIIAAIESLDLSAVLLRQGKSIEAASVTLKAADTFIRLKIQREALLAVILLRDSFLQHTATVEMVEEVSRFLRRLELDPSLRFEGRAWEEREFPEV